MKKILHKSHGFTIVEMLIYGGILAMFLVVLTTLFSSLIEDQLSVETTSAIAQDSRYIIARLSYDMESATSIATPSALGVASPTLSLVINGVTNTYSVANRNLVLTNNNGTNQLNSVGTAVSNASFIQYGNPGKKNTIRMSLTLTTTTQRISGADTKTVETTVALR